MTIDYEEGLLRAITDYKEGERSRWKAAFDIEELWLAYTERHGEIMAVLVAELGVTDDQVYNLLHAAELAGLTDSTRRLTDALTVSHFSRLCRASEKYKLPQEAVVEYLETAAEHNISAQAMIDQVAQAFDPDPQYVFHKALRGAARACRKLLQVADYNGLEKRAREAARLLLDILEDLK